MSQHAKGVRTFQDLWLFSTRWIFPRQNSKSLTKFHELAQPPYSYSRLQVIERHDVGVVSNGIMFIPLFVAVGQTSKWIDRQNGDLMSLFFFRLEKQKYAQYLDNLRTAGLLLTDHCDDNVYISPSELLEKCLPNQSHVLKHTFNRNYLSSIRKQRKQTKQNCIKCTG